MRMHYCAAMSICTMIEQAIDLCRIASLRRWLTVMPIMAAASCLTPSNEAFARAPNSLAAACWPNGIAPAHATETKPVRGGPAANVAIPQRELAAFAPVPPQMRGAIRRVELPAGRKLIALTLDLCEQPGELAGYDGPVFDYLRAQSIKATVFAGGKWLVTHPERAHQLLSDPLFEMANHGWSHRNVRALAGQNLIAEITGPQRAYEASRAALAARACVAPQQAALSNVPTRMRLHRFPYGACNKQALEAVAEQGLLAIQWDVSTGDPSPTQSATAIAGQILRNAKPGSIIIAHANGRGHHTAAALPLAIPKLRAMGYEFVTVSELLAAGRPVIAETCYDSRPGDTDRYDFLFSRPSTSPPSRNDWSTTTLRR